MVDNDLDPDFDIEDKPGTASYKRRRGAAEGGANGPETVEKKIGIGKSFTLVAQGLSNKDIMTRPTHRNNYR